MRVVIDIEANGLENPTKVWLVVCKDIDTGDFHIFREPSTNETEAEKLREHLRCVEQVIGHNILEYDLPVLRRLIGGFDIPVDRVVDTLIVSRLVDYSRKAHSIEQYGLEFGYEKIKFSDFSKYSLEMETYCVRDVEICALVYERYLRVLSDVRWRDALDLEHAFQVVVNNLHGNGFAFDTDRAAKLLARVEKELGELDEKILKEFPPREVLIREFTPKATKYGTISKTSVPRSLWEKIHEYEIGQTYRHTKLEPFNPASHKQLIEVLHEAGWSPVDKTKTHTELERELNRARYNKSTDARLDLEDIRAKLLILGKYGWKINENNLSTLPESAPSPARLLARRILLESRRRTLTEWLALVDQDDCRIHGKFYGIGAWTHRMAHQNPNTANIPGEFQLDGSKKLYGKEMRSLWCAPKGKLLVGVDAEGIQLRIFAHYINDPEFTDALVKGKKDDKTDPHSLNQRIMGRVCKSRAAAKRFIYALLLGAGIGKLAEILECPIEDAREALDRILERYTGFAKLKQEVLPNDGRRGYFIGLDGRKVAIPGDTPGARTHLAMSGYLQNGEAIVMKKACLKWHGQLEQEFGNDGYLARGGSVRHSYGNRSNIVLPANEIQIVNFVHDEWQTEVPNDLTIALKVAKLQADSLREVGEELKLNCPLAGSYWNDDHKDYTIGVNWYATH